MEIHISLLIIVHDEDLAASPGERALRPRNQSASITPTLKMDGPLLAE
jgi:hypothetical protein